MSKKQEMKLNYRQRAGISFIEQEDPSFIKKMKAQLGYREPSKIEDKFNEEEPSTSDGHDEDDILRMRDEEKPLVVVLESTDISQEELDKEVSKLKEQEDRKLIEEGKITFKKPIKRKAEDDEKITNEEKPRENLKQPKKADSRLLSFNQDEDE